MSGSLKLPWRAVLATILVWAALLATWRVMVFRVPEGATGAMRVAWPWWRAYLVSAGELAMLLPLFLFVRRQVERMPLTQTPWRVLLGRHALWAAVLAPAFVLLELAGLVLATTLTAGFPEAVDLLQQTSLKRHIGSLAYSPLHYAVAATGLYAWAAARLARERERQKLRLERQLAESQLEVLRHQLSPHFLFNTLNGITALIRRDPGRAEDMTLALTDFLRATLEQGSTPTHPLAREVTQLDRYLEIQQLRFPGRIQVVKDLAPAALDHPVPTLLLQPLAENAIRHGLAPRISGGTLTLRACLRDRHLHLDVEDDGLGAAAAGGGTGLGLAHTRERLAQLYGGEAQVAAGPRPEGGYRVSLTLPVRSA